MTTPKKQLDQVQWFEDEKPLLYDYLVRMTGDPDPASTTILEVIQAVTGKIRGREERSVDVRLVLFKTARSFCAERWHKVPNELIEAVYKGINDNGDLRALEDYIASFDSYQREALFLKFRYGFVATEIASLTGKSLYKVQEMINQGVLKIRERFADFVPQNFKQLPIFEIKDVEAMSTVALSKIIQVEKLERFGFVKGLFWFVLTIAIAGYYIYFG